VRPVGRYQPAVRAWAGMRASLQPQSFALVLWMRLHLLAAPDGTPRAAILASADEKKRDVALRLLARGLHGGELVIADKGYAGKDFEARVWDPYQI
jgi:hypothetical protein